MIHFHADGTMSRTTERATERRTGISCSAFGVLFMAFVIGILAGYVVGQWQQSIQRQSINNVSKN